MARTRETIGEVVLKGAKNADSVLVTQRDQDLLVKECYGTSVPSAKTGYAMGAHFVNTSTGEQYYNTGSATSCTFTSDAVVGLTATATELNYNDITALGSGQASKTVTLDAYKTARVGDWVGSQAAGSAVVFAAGLNKYADGQLDILSAFGESTSDLTSAYSAKCGRFRHLVSCVADTVIAHETYGMVGQLSVKNGSLNHYHSGIMGTFETGTLCHVQTSYCAAAVMARPGGSGTTVESGGLLAGFAAVQNMSAVTATGTYAAFATHKTAAGVAWPTGLYMQSGSVTTGIDLAGGFTTGVSITNAVLGVTDSRAIKISTSQEAAAMADGYGIVEIDHTITGTAGSNFSGCALSSWVNIPSGTVGSGKYVCAQNNGVYEATAATITGARIIFGMRCQKLLDDTDATSFPFSINTNNTAITALIDVNNTTDLGWITGAASAGGGHIPLFRDNAGVVHYVNTYTS